LRHEHGTQQGKGQDGEHPGRDTHIPHAAFIAWRASSRLASASLSL
jgi:hypothetical protein